MSIQDLKVAAANTLSSAFNGTVIPVHIVQAAVAVLMMQD